MRNARIHLLSVGLALGVGVVLGCEKEESRAPGDEGNLCTDYKTCNECIAGQQTKGATEGEAETQCGAAVLGCWTTWDKPIVCGEKKHEEKPAS
jgi:hypothetical protein